MSSDKVPQDVHMSVEILDKAHGGHNGFVNSWKIPEARSNDAESSKRGPEEP